MDEPLYVVFNAARRWMTTTNFDLFIYSDRLVAVRGFTVRSGLREARVERKTVGKASWAESETRRRRREAERVADALRLREEDVLAQYPENDAVRIDSICDARFRRRVGVCWLALSLADGEIVKWMWLSRYAPYEEAEPVLRRVLGERLAR
jgi:hypothetical protein